MPFPISRVRVQAIKHFLAEMTTITLGILIALALEGYARQREETRLARQAAAAIRSEMRDNLSRLQEELSSKVTLSREQIHNAVAKADAVLKHRASHAPGPAPKPGTFELNIPIVTLSDTSHATAQATGAFAHMDYAEVRDFAVVYNVQKEFQRVQSQLSESFVLMIPADPADLPDQSTADLERWRHSLLTTLQYLHHFEAVARSLARAYGSLLSS
jgi:hypothetical protein